MQVYFSHNFIECKYVNFYLKIVGDKYCWIQWRDSRVAAKCASSRNYCNTFNTGRIKEMAELRNTMFSDSSYKMLWNFQHTVFSCNMHEARYSLTLNIPSLARQRCLPSWGLRRTPWFFVISQLFDAVDYSNYVFWVSETIIQWFKHC